MFCDGKKLLLLLFLNVLTGGGGHVVCSQHLGLLLFGELRHCGASDASQFMAQSPRSIK